MRLRAHLAAVAGAGVLILASIATEVTHNRCLELQSGDGDGAYYRFVTRDDLTPAAAMATGACVRVRFRQQFGLEEHIDEDRP